MPSTRRSSCLNIARHPGNQHRINGSTMTCVAQRKPPVGGLCFLCVVLDAVSGGAPRNEEGRPARTPPASSRYRMDYWLTEPSALTRPTP